MKLTRVDGGEDGSEGESFNAVRPKEPRADGLEERLTSTKANGGEVVRSGRQSREGRRGEGEVRAKDDSQRKIVVPRR